MDNFLNILPLPSQSQLLEFLCRRTPGQPLYVKVGETVVSLTWAALTGDCTDVVLAVVTEAPDYAPYIISDDSELGRQILELARMASNGRKYIIRNAWSLLSQAFGVAFSSLGIMLSGNSRNGIQCPNATAEELCQKGDILKGQQQNAAAFEAYQASARGGSGWGMYHLAECYDYGLGTDISKARAKEWYYRAAEQNISDARLRAQWLDEHPELM